MVWGIAFFFRYSARMAICVVLPQPSIPSKLRNRPRVAMPDRAEPPQVAKVRLDFAAYAYYCATLQEVFTDQLDDTHMVKATSTPSEPVSFDSLAAARNAFTTDTLLAWNLTTRCRIAWSLETRKPGGPEVHHG